MRTASDSETALGAIGTRTADIVILDLSTQIDLYGIVEAAKKPATEAARIIAFGPHVHVERLAAARAAGCDEVVSRGQFFARLDAILQMDAGA
jgi:hypothetical protein